MNKMCEGYVTKLWKLHIFITSWSEYLESMKLNEMLIGAFGVFIHPNGLSFLS